MNKEIFEGWTVSDFINELEGQVAIIMEGGSWKKPFQTKKELAKWCTDNQPHYKKPIPEVMAHFAKLYNLK